MSPHPFEGLVKHQAVPVVVVFVALSGCQLAEPSRFAQGSSALVGGAATLDYSGVPYLITTAGDGSQTACSGALIAESVVLTAAHCVDGKPEGTSGIAAYFGTQFSDDDPAFIESIEASSWEVYDPGWGFDGDDIAVVHLEEAASSEPLAFNTTPLTEDSLGQTLTLVGWGRTAADTADAGTKRVVEASITRFESDVVLNYGDANANHCHGDSGGPGLVSVAGEPTIASVASWQTGECRGRSGGTRVAAYSSWLSTFALGEPAEPMVLEVLSPRDGDDVVLGFEIELAVEEASSPVTRIEVYADGQLAMVDTEPSRPFIYAMPKTLPLGPTELEVAVRDQHGATASEKLAVTIASPSTPPTEEPTSGSGGGCRAAGGRGGSLPWLVLFALMAVLRRPGGLAR